MHRNALERHQLSQISGQTFNRRRLRSEQAGLFYTKVVQLQENDRSWTEQQQVRGETRVFDFPQTLTNCILVIYVFY